MCLVGKLHLVRVTVPVLYPIMLPAGIDYHWDFQLPPFSLVVKRGELEDESKNHLFSLPKRTEITFVRRFSMKLKTATPVAHNGIQHQLAIQKSVEVTVPGIQKSEGSLW